MGYNTTVLLYNDRSDRWPEEILRAAQSWTRHELRRSYDEVGSFGFGQVVACEHADHSQVCVLGRNSGRYLTASTPPQRPSDLEVLAKVLRGQGYHVRAPGEKRAKGPLPWGYAAQLAKSETQ